MKLLLIFTFALVLLGTVGHAQQAVARLDAVGDAPRQVATPGVPPTPATADNLSCQVLTGRVTDRFAYPLVGASLTLRSPGKKGISLDASITNGEGRYIITTKQPIPRTTVLEVSAAGYDTLEVPLPNCQPQDITLELLPGTVFKANGRIKRTSRSGSKVR